MYYKHFKSTKCEGFSIVWDSWQEFKQCYKDYKTCIESLMNIKHNESIIYFDKLCKKNFKMISPYKDDNNQPCISFFTENYGDVIEMMTILFLNYSDIVTIEAIKDKTIKEMKQRIDIQEKTIS